MQNFILLTRPQTRVPLDNGLLRLRRHDRFFWYGLPTPRLKGEERTNERSRTPRNQGGVSQMRKEALVGMIALCVSLLWLSATPARLGAG